jgi:hypothetical protein
LAASGFAGKFGDGDRGDRAYGKTSELDCRSVSETLDAVVEKSLALEDWLKGLAQAEKEDSHCEDEKGGDSKEANFEIGGFHLNFNDLLRAVS